jgi:hypothetical protein
LRLFTEDSLYQIIKDSLSIDAVYSSLFEFVRFEHLTVECISDFLSFISNSFEFLTFPIWSAFIRRHSLSNSHQKRQDHDVFQSFIARDGFPLEGIISFLTEKRGGNLQEKGAVEVSASGTEWSDCPLKHILDFKSISKGFATDSVTNSWIRIDFLNYQINPTHYSIRTRTDWDGCHPRSWVIEGSDDSGRNWIELDRQSQNCELNGLGVVRTFSIVNNSTVRSIRIRQTGVDSNGYNHLVLKCIEFFGNLLPSSQ